MREWILRNFVPGMPRGLCDVRRWDSRFGTLPFGHFRERLGGLQLSERRLRCQRPMLVQRGLDQGIQRDSMCLLRSRILPRRERRLRGLRARLPAMRGWERDLRRLQARVYPGCQRPHEVRRCAVGDELWYGVPGWQLQ